MSGIERNNKGQFIAGRVYTPEERLLASQRLHNSWRKRDDYIADIRGESPYIYNSWRSFMFSYKGKKAGHDSRWDDFRTFYNDVRPSYVKGKVFRRLDEDKPYGPDNFVWVTSREAPLLRKQHLVMLKYNGEEHSLRDWALIAGVSVYAIKVRYYRHPEYSVEEVIFGKKKDRNAKRPHDYRDADCRETMKQKAAHMVSAYKAKDRKLGVSVCDMDSAWFIQNIMTKPCIYCGDTRRIGADRIENDKGHTKDNVVPCCYECNVAKNSNFTYAEMKIIGAAIREVKKQRADQRGENISIEIK